MSETNKGGRPIKRIDWKAVEAMLIGGLTGSDIATALGMSQDHFYRRVRLEKGCNLSVLQDQYRAEMRHRLRAAQIKTALGFWQEKVEIEYIIMPDGSRVPSRQTVTKFYHPPSAAMLIFLGKNMLGQSDNPERADEGNSTFGNIPNYRMIGDVGQEDQNTTQFNVENDEEPID